jgi:hypothetical protein
VSFLKLPKPILLVYLEAAASTGEKSLHEIPLAFLNMIPSFALLSYDYQARSEVSSRSVSKFN